MTTEPSGQSQLTDEKELDSKVPRLAIKLKYKSEVIYETSSGDLGDGDNAAKVDEE